MPKTKIKKTRKEVKKTKKEAKNIRLKFYAPHRTYPLKKYRALKEAIWKVIKKLTPEENQKFNLNKICSPLSTKGLLKDTYPSFKMEDKYAFYNIIEELVRKDKKLICVAGRWYARV